MNVDFRNKKQTQNNGVIYMKRSKTVFALLAFLLACAPIAHAMDTIPEEDELVGHRAWQEQEEKEEQDEQDSDNSDSKLTDSESDASIEPEELSPLEIYKNQLRNHAISYGHKPLDGLHAIILQPKPDDQATHKKAYKYLTDGIIKAVAKIKAIRANPNQINPNTKNTALADFFINHHVNNAYMRAVIECMTEYGACVENITDNQSDLRHLVQGAIVSGTLTQAQYDALLESKTYAVAEHFKAERAQQQKLRSVQARAKALKKKQDRARERAVKRNKKRKPNLATIPE
jgi:hypothetical protein